MVQEVIVIPRHTRSKTQVIISTELDMPTMRGPFHILLARVVPRRAAGRTHCLGAAECVVVVVVVVVDRNNTHTQAAWPGQAWQLAAAAAAGRLALLPIGATTTYCSFIRNVGHETKSLVHPRRRLSSSNTAMCVCVCVSSRKNNQHLPLW
jgi:hypothetical protein